VETTLAIVGPFGRYAAGAMEARAKRDRREAKRMVVVAYLTDPRRGARVDHRPGLQGPFVPEGDSAVRQDEDKSRDPCNGTYGHVTLFVRGAASGHRRQRQTLREEGAQSHGTP
jgi:hypothetical protein